MEPEGTRSSTVCVGFSSPSGRCCQVRKLPHPLQQASACLLSVAKAWSAGISRTLDFLLCIARQGWQQAGDRESGLWGGEQEEVLVFSMKWGARSPWDARDMMVVGRQCSLSGQGWLRQMGIKGKQ